MDTAESLPEPPPGWSVALEKGRLIYQTSHPVVKIHSVAALKEYHKKGRYLTVDPSDLIFSRKKLKLERKHADEEKMDTDVYFDSELRVVNENFEVEYEYSHEIPNLDEKVTKIATKETDNKEEREVKKSKLEKDVEKVRFAVQNLTIDPSKKVDHREALAKAANKLSIARVYKRSDDFDSFDISDLKVKVNGEQKTKRNLLVSSGIFQPLKQSFQHCSTLNI